MNDSFRIETKVQINFPRFIYFFLKRLSDEIWEADLDLETTLLSTIDAPTNEFPYCYEAFEIIRKTFKMKGYAVGLPTFTRDLEKDKPDITHYKFRIKKLAYDDLPF